MTTLSAHEIPFTKGDLLPENNRNFEILEGREDEMQAFLINGIGQLMELREQPDEFETLRRLLIACDHFAFMTQMQRRWTSPFDILENMQTSIGSVEHHQADLRWESPEYTFWSELVLQADNVHVAKVLRSILGSCCTTGDCVDFRRNTNVSSTSLG